MENNIICEVIDKQETKVIYTKDMMDYEINVYGTEDNPLFLIRDIVAWLEYKDQNIQRLKFLNCVTILKR